MKFFILGSLLFVSQGFAQTIDLSSLKKIMTQRKDVLESIHVGMSKKVVLNGEEKLDDGICHYTVSSVHTVLKLEGSKMILMNQEAFTPATSAVCKNAGYEAFEEKILFYEDRPSLQQDLADLDTSAVNIRSISKAGDKITLQMQVNQDLLQFIYDLSKSSFKNLISEEGPGFKVTTTDMKDIDVNTLDLTNVKFCENNDGNTAECTQGDYSDILF